MDRVRPGFAQTTRNALHGKLPDRYLTPWREALDVPVRNLLVPGTQILDVGSGRRPTIPVEWRPAGSTYIGLDLSDLELRKAPRGSYDDWIAANILDPIPELQDQFDLIVSWQVLEHVAPLQTAIENMRSYLRPGGTMIVQMSGRYTPFSLLNLAIPSQASTWLLERLLQRDPETVFPAQYDKCYYTALHRLLQRWSKFQVEPRFLGANYLRFSPVLQAAYITFEEWCIRTNRYDLATYYLVNATK